MVITYRAERSDVWHAYWRTWRNSARLNALRVLIFGLVFFWAHVMAWSVGPTARVGVALAAAIGVIVLLPLYPMLRFKHDERTLTIAPSGIATTIGGKSSEIPWRKMARIEPNERCIYIFAKNGNSFTIP